MGMISGGGKTGKAAALPKFSDTLNLSQLGMRGRLCSLIGFPLPKKFRDYAPVTKPEVHLTKLFYDCLCVFEKLTLLFDYR